MPNTSMPLHIALAYILTRLFPTHATDVKSPAEFSTGFVSNVLAIVSREVFEVGSAPATFESLRDEIDALVQREHDRTRRVREKRRVRGLDIGDEPTEEEIPMWMGSMGRQFEDVPSGCAFLDVLEKDIRERVNEDDEEDMTDVPEPFERRSPLGLFLRRTMLALRKLSFTETSALARSVGHWCSGNAAGPSNLGGASRKYAMEDTIRTRSQAMDRMRSSMDSGDYSAALDSLRRFYDYQFPSSHRGRHQHALLNLASFHYSTGGLPSAQEAINEAIRAARAEGDKSCLSHCMSLLHRIEADTHSAPGPSRARTPQRPIDDQRVPKITAPMDELWGLRVALEMGEPVHIAQRRLYLALGRYESTRVKAEDKQMQGWLTEHTFDEDAWHTTQAALYGMMGSKTLAEAHESLALEETSSSDSRIVVLAARAERLAQRGEYDNALALLLDFDNLDGMDISSFRRWSSCLWDTLRLQADLSDDGPALDLLNALQPKRSDDTISYLSNAKNVSAHEAVRQSLQKADKMIVRLDIVHAATTPADGQNCETPPHLILPHVLSAIQLSSELGLWPLYRLGVVIFTEVLLNMDAHDIHRKAVDEITLIWPELMESGDEATIARAALVLGKAFVETVVEEDEMDVTEHAEEQLQRALEAAKRVGYKAVIDTSISLLALLAHLKDDQAGATRMQREWEEINLVEGERDRLREQVRSVAEVIKLVSVRLSENWT